MALWKHKQLLSGCLCDVASGLSNRNRQFSTGTLNQSLPHDAHECGIPCGVTLTLLKSSSVINPSWCFLWQLSQRVMDCRGASPPVFRSQMVDVKPDLFFLGCVCSAALTGVIISPKHVLPYIVVTIHLALLVIPHLAEQAFHPRWLSAAAGRTRRSL